MRGQTISSMNTKQIIFGTAATLAGAWLAVAPAVAAVTPTVAATTPTPDNTNQVAGAGQPKIQFQSAEFDFGKISTGELVKHEFIFTNTGAATLEIRGVKPGCGCTSSGQWDHEVAPGKTGVIPLQYNSAGFGGPVTKTTTVTCNDPDHPTVVLTLKGTVAKPIEVTPSMAMFNLPSDGQTNETKVLRIVNNLDEPLTLSDVQCTNQSFRTELKIIRPGREFELHVTSVPPFSAPTTVATVSIKTSSAKMPVINLQAYVMVPASVLVQPDRFFLPAGPLRVAMKPSVSIRNNSTTALTLSEPTANVPGVEVQVQETQAGRLFSLIASFPEGFQVPPGQSVEVTVKSNHPKFPLIRVPIFQANAVPRQPPVSPASASRPGGSPVAPPLPRPLAPAGQVQVPAVAPVTPVKP